MRGLGVYWCYLFVYPDRASMIRAIRRYNRCDIQDGDDENLNGMFQSACDKDGTDGAFIGVIRLCEEALTFEVVIHEVVHAAIEACSRIPGVSREDLVGYEPVTPDPESGIILSTELPGEELLAHEIGEMADDAVGGLLRIGFSFGGA